MSIRVKSISDQILINDSNKNVNFYDKDRSKWSAIDGKVVFSYYEDIGEGIMSYKEKFSAETRSFSEPKESSIGDLLVSLNNLINTPITTEVEANVIYSSYESSLTNGGEIDSGWIDMGSVDKVQFSGYASASGMTMTLESRADEDQTPLSTPVTYSEGTFYMFNVICRQRWLRFKWTNNTGGLVSNVSMEVKQTFGSSDKLSVFPLSVNPTDFSQAALVQSVPRGRQPDGDYVSVPADGTAVFTDTPLTSGSSYTSSWIDSDGFNEIDITIISDQVSVNDGVELQFTDDANIATPLVSYTIKYTFNQEDISRGFLKIKNSPSLDGFRVKYTNGSTNQTSFLLAVDLRVNGDVSIYNSGGASILSDFGTEVSLGNIKNYSSHLIKGRNSDVSIGTVPEDISEIGGVYTGQPTSFTSETVTAVSSSGNDTSAGTGARTIRIHGLKTSTSTNYETEDLTMNGTTQVTSSSSWWRINFVEVLTAGSGETNAGIITIAATTTTSVVFSKIPVGYGESQLAMFTVPFGKKAQIRRVRIGITRASGSVGSASIGLGIRPSGGVFKYKMYEPQTGGTINTILTSGIICEAGADIKFQVKSVSDNNTICEGEIELFLINC